MTNTTPSTNTGSSGGLPDQRGEPSVNATSAEERPSIGLDAPLPLVRFDHAPDEVIRRLDTAARRGKLPGFASPGSTGSLFSVAAFGTPWDGVVEAHVRERMGNGCLIEPRSRLKRLGPVIFGIVLALSIWPGVLLTESLIASYFPAGWSKWTWYWYLPMTVPTMPWALWWSIRTSRAQIHDSAHRAVQAIALHAAGRLEFPTLHTPPHHATPPHPSNPRSAPVGPSA